MLGRSAGLNEAKLAHIGDEPLPPGVYTDEEEAIVRYAQRSTRNQPIDDGLYAELSNFLSNRQLMELCFTVGVANVINRFHATFLTDLDATTKDALGPSCPLPLPMAPLADPQGPP